ncbi:neutral zinc metallopeptidase [Actinokineospora auranticolor]|uniref:Metalloprotease n=1 Tax=Actinokineospora auranticolor TaxID=155976 RepID=A0A2S6GC80_9PSEU|nr:neutral zinc metallopeptidase [Actinokineospora auranticolor]PPK62212.1 hypothetical protein CLV40_13623 [Actinokineospora auranticolor]
MDEFGRGPYYGPMPSVPVAIVGPRPESRFRRSVVLILVLAMLVVGIFWVVLVGRMAAGMPRPVTGTPLAVGEIDRGQSAKSLVDLAANSLLKPGSKLPTTDCELPEFDTDRKDLESYYLAAIDCLNRAWRPVVLQAGNAFVPPKLDTQDSPKSDCGEGPSEEEATAFYCSEDRTIYMPRVRLIDAVSDYPELHMAVLAHEYGHHVQYLSDILYAERLLENSAPKDESLELSRRTELQANCFAGVFLAAIKDHGSISSKFADDSVAGYDGSDDTDTHGTAHNRGMWAKRGLEAGNTIACDTWSAPVAEVK